MIDFEQLIEDLASFRTRAQAKNQLLREGSAAVAPLIDALSHPIEGARWSAAALLGKLGDRRALEPLREQLDDPVLSDAARDAIRAIKAAAGADAPERPPARAPSAASSEDEIVAAIVRAAPAGITMDAAGSGTTRALRVHLPDGRKQDVRLDLNASDTDGERLLVVYTVCAPVPPDHLEAALRLNAKLRFAALAIADIEGEPHFVMVASHRYAGLDIESVRRSVLELARRGDALEKALTASDVR